MAALKAGAEEARLEWKQAQGVYSNEMRKVSKIISDLDHSEESEKSHTRDVKVAKKEGGDHEARVQSALQKRNKKELKGHLAAKGWRCTMDESLINEDKNPGTTEEVARTTIHTKGIAEEDVDEYLNENYVAHTTKNNDVETTKFYAYMKEEGSKTFPGSTDEALAALREGSRHVATSLKALTSEAHNLPELIFVLDRLTETKAAANCARLVDAVVNFVSDESKSHSDNVLDFAEKVTVARSVCGKMPIYAEQLKPKNIYVLFWNTRGKDLDSIVEIHKAQPYHEKTNNLTHAYAKVMEVAEKWDAKKMVKSADAAPPQQVAATAFATNPAPHQGGGPSRNPQQGAPHTHPYEPIVCYMCGKSGHIARNCPNKAANLANSLESTDVPDYEWNHETHSWIPKANNAYETEPMESTDPTNGQPSWMQYDAQQNPEDFQ
ncbi:hypothetical protein HDU98_005318 [Podochytrium sp. JEL0797]|nr:hypothetical protein HDU98_005318 [Podochytrium sp. JEL0797]